MFQSLMKSLKFAMAFPAGILLMTFPACAKDYRLDYGIETPTDSDAGSTSCPYGVCRVKVEKLNFTIVISLSRDNLDRARVEIEGGPGCCFFELGARSRMVAPSDPPERLRLFSGMAARGLLAIQNEPVGNLYLRFHLD